MLSPTNLLEFLTPITPIALTPNLAMVSACEIVVIPQILMAVDVGGLILLVPISEEVSRINLFKAIY